MKQDNSKQTLIQKVTRTQFISALAFQAFFAVYFSLLFSKLQSLAEL
jgi:hypothetical protein